MLTSVTVKVCMIDAQRLAVRCRNSNGVRFAEKKIRDPGESIAVSVEEIQDDVVEIVRSYLMLVPLCTSVGPGFKLEL